MTRRRRTVLAIAVLAGVALAYQAARPVEGQAPVAPDAIYYNAKVVTVDDRFSYAQALAIAGDRFTAVGTNEEVRRLAGPATRQIDLKGLTVTPGLTDNHLHTAGGGPGVDLSRARTLDDVLTAVAARSRQAKPGDVVVSNSDWHEAQLKEQRLPLRRDLDKVAPDVAVVLVRGGHEYIVNSAALRKWNITKTTPEPAGGRITQYADGELNGELVDRARQLVTLPARPPRSMEQRIQDQVEEYNKLHAAGLTAVRHPGGSIEDYRLRKDMQRRGILTMRVTQLLGVDRGGNPAAIEQAVKGWNLPPTDGDALLRLGGIKLGVDGGFEGGFMRDPYEEPYGEGGKYRGLQTVPQERYNAIVGVLNRLDWRVFTHAVGDAAIDQVLAGYEAANEEKSIVGKRWGIEHGFIPRADQFPRMKRLGLHVTAQNHLTRETITGGPLGPDQRISREDALRLVTRNHWYLSFEENSKGIIAPGRYADMVVLAEDIMTVPAKRIEQMNVLMTMVGGKTVYRHADYGKVSLSK